MNTKMDKRFSSQTICKIFLVAKIVSKEQIQDILQKEKRVKKGDIIVMVTAGIGFSWGSAVFQY